MQVRCMIVGLIAILLIFTGISSASSKTVAIDEVFAEFFKDYMGFRPEWMSQMGDLTQFGLASRHGELNDYSDDKKQEFYQMLREKQEILTSYDSAQLTRDQQVAQKVLLWYIDDQLRGAEFANHKYLVDHFFGVQNSLPETMLTAHPLTSKSNVEDYVKRLEQFDRAIGQVLAGIEVRADEGFIPPTYIIDLVIEQCELFIDKPITSHEMYTHLKDRINQIEGLSDEKKTTFLTNAEKAMESSVYPAYEQMIADLTALKDRSTITAGIWELPNGKEYYEYLVRHYTTTDLTPEEIHNLGLTEVERIQKEILATMQEMGVSSRIFIRSETLYGDEIIPEYQRIATEMEAKLPEMFGILPQSKVDIQPLPEMKAKTMSASFYSRPALDGSKPGVFIVNLGHPHILHDAFSLAYHETVPGHHLQMAIQMESEYIPAIQKVLSFTAYTEGWALYAEKLAGEYGGYEELTGKYGQLTSELFRAVRLVVDTGIHYKKWTRDEAFQYMSSLGMGYLSEIDRYIMMPGQALAYKVGELKMIQLRQRAEQKLGDQFDIREFHDLVLKNGTMPLEILEELVVQYIAEKQ